MKVGDRVVGVGKYDGKNIDGKKGTIVDSDDYFCSVEFDEDIGGHDCLGKAKDGHGWNVDEEHFRTTTSITFTDGASITLTVEDLDRFNDWPSYDYIKMDELNKKYYDKFEKELGELAIKEVKELKKKEAK